MTRASAPETAVFVVGRHGTEPAFAEQDVVARLAACDDLDGTVTTGAPEPVAVPNSAAVAALVLDAGAQHLLVRGADRRDLGIVSLRDIADALLRVRGPSMPTLTMPTAALSEVIERIDGLRAEVLASPADVTDPGRWRLLRDQALGELTVGLPDVDCAVCIAHAPQIPGGEDASTVTDSRGRLLSWLSGTREQLRMGRAVADVLARSRSRSSR